MRTAQYAPLAFFAQGSLALLRHRAETKTNRVAALTTLDLLDHG